MAKSHDDEKRELFRVEFAKSRENGLSILESSKRAGISPSSYYAWNQGDAWLRKGGWSKDGWNKGGW